MNRTLEAKETLIPGSRADRLAWEQEEEDRARYTPRIMPPVPDAIASYYQARAGERRRAVRILEDALLSSKERRMVIQKDGRLSAAAWQLLDDAMKKAGIPMSAEERLERTKSRKAVYSPPGSSMKIIPVKSKDIGRYLKEDWADMGVIGQDQIVEQDIDPETRLRLGDAECSFVAAVPSTSKLKRLKDLDGKTVATSYPRLLNDFVNETGILPARTIQLGGSVEAAAVLGIADAIFDLEESGRSLKENGLRRLGTIRDIEAEFVARYP